MAGNNDTGFLSVAGVVALALAIAWQTSSAGPIRDRITEHRLAREQQKVLEEAASAEPESFPAGTRIVRDVSYGTDGLQRFDVYSPAEAEDAPVIFMVHGGAWSLGDKAALAVVENKVARWIPKGFVVVSANYRMLPKVRPVEQARDVARALAAAQAGAAAWGGDKRKFILMGHSAGAHLVALVATSLPVSSGIVSTPWLGTVSLDSAALDVVKVMQAKHARLYDRAFGDDPDYWRSASPFHALTDAGRPMLLVCSGQRNDSCPQARWFLARATALGMQASVLEWDFSHKELNQRLGEDPAYTAAVESFMAGLDESVARKLSIHAGEMQPRGSR